MMHNLSVWNELEFIEINYTFVWYELGFIEMKYAFGWNEVGSNEMNQNEVALIRMNRINQKSDHNEVGLIGMKQV